MKNENIYYRDQKITQGGYGGSQNTGIPENNQQTVRRETSANVYNNNNNRQTQSQIQVSSVSSGYQTQTQYQPSSGNTGTYQVQSQNQNYVPNYGQGSGSADYNNNDRYPSTAQYPPTTPRTTYKTTTSYRPNYDNRNQQEYSQQGGTKKHQPRPTQMLQNVPDDNPLLRPNEKLSIVIEYPSSTYNINADSKIIR